MLTITALMDLSEVRQLEIALGIASNPGMSSFFFMIGYVN